MEKREKVFNALVEIFRTELEDPNLVITEQSSANNVERWDSINNLTIISQVENKFDITFPIELIFEIQNVGDMCNYIVKESKVI